MYSLYVPTTSLTTTTCVLPYRLVIASCIGQCCSRCSAVMSALHGQISDSPTLNLLYMCALSLLCPLLNLNRITCSALFSLWRLTDCSLGVDASIFSWRGF